MDRLWDRFFVEDGGWPVWSPSLDVSETKMILLSKQN